MKNEDSKSTEKKGKNGKRNLGDHLMTYFLPVVTEQELESLFHQSESGNSTIYFRKTSTGNTVPRDSVGSPNY